MAASPALESNIFQSFFAQHPLMYPNNLYTISHALKMAGMASKEDKLMRCPVLGGQSTWGSIFILF
jgi:hypothetical protein